MADLARRFHLAWAVMQRFMPIKQPEAERRDGGMILSSNRNAWAGMRHAALGSRRGPRPRPLPRPAKATSMRLLNESFGVEAGLVVFLPEPMARTDT